MVGEKDFPVILIWETDRMVFEMPIGINGFVIAVTPINVCPGIGRVVDDCKDAAVGQSPPGDLAIPGFIGWILPYFIYKSVVKKQEEKAAPLIEAKMDEIYEICEKGNRLLN